MIAMQTSAKPAMVKRKVSSISSSQSRRIGGELQSRALYNLRLALTRLQDFVEQVKLAIGRAAQVKKIAEPIGIQPPVPSVLKCNWAP